MIRLTRLNNQPLAVNSDLIKFVEQSHDTVLTLVNGEKIVVRENLDSIVDAILTFRRSVLAGVGLMGSLPIAGCIAVPKTNDDNAE